MNVYGWGPKTSATAGLVLAAAIAGELLAQTAPQAPPTFRADNRTVQIRPTVWSADGRLAPYLTQADFQILDNGQPAPITVFAKEIHPITVAVMIDMSGSMNARLLRAREGAIYFARALRQVDRARIGSFGSEIIVSPILTNDAALLERVLREELWPGGGTPLWNGVFAAMRSLEREPGRRAVLALTDGYDTGGLAGWTGGYGQVREFALEHNTAFYAVLMDAMAMNIMGAMNRPDDVGRLAEDTGGGSFEMPLEADLKSAFAQIADELRTQYVIGFTPAQLDGKEHKVEVRVPKGMKVRARKTFVASR